MERQMVVARRLDNEPSSWYLRDTEMQSKWNAGQKRQQAPTGFDWAEGTSPSHAAFTVMTAAMPLK